MERQKILNSQHDTEEEQGWKTDTTWLQDLLKNQSNQDSTVVTKERAEHTGEPGNRWASK